MRRLRWPENVIPGSEILCRFGLETLECPFCRSENIGLYAGPIPHMTCVNCGADGPLPERKPTSEETQREAVVLWNQRAV